MSQIVFYETQFHYYGFKTFETSAKYAKGCEIRDTDGCTYIVIKAVEATPANYDYAHRLLAFCKRHGGFADFKYNLEK